MYPVQNLPTGVWRLPNEWRGVSSLALDYATEDPHGFMPDWVTLMVKLYFGDYCVPWVALVGGETAPRWEKYFW